MGGTPLHAACWRVQIDIIRLLLRSGAELDVVDRNGQTAVDMAETMVGNVEVATVFREEGGVVLGSCNGRERGHGRGVVNGKIPKYRTKWKPRVIR